MSLLVRSNTYTLSTSDSTVQKSNGKASPGPVVTKNKIPRRRSALPAPVSTSKVEVVKDLSYAEFKAPLPVTSSTGAGVVSRKRQIPRAQSGTRTHKLPVPSKLPTRPSLSSSYHPKKTNTTVTANESMLQESQLNTTFTQDIPDIGATASKVQQPALINNKTFELEVTGSEILKEVNLGDSFYSESRGLLSPSTFEEELESNDTLIDEILGLTDAVIDVDAATSSGSDTNTATSSVYSSLCGESGTDSGSTTHRDTGVSSSPSEQLNWDNYQHQTEIAVGKQTITRMEVDQMDVDEGMKRKGEDEEEEEERRVLREILVRGGRDTRPRSDGYSLASTDTGYQGSEAPVSPPPPVDGVWCSGARQARVIDGKMYTFDGGESSMTESQLQSATTSMTESQADTLKATYTVQHVGADKRDEESMDVEECDVPSTATQPVPASKRSGANVTSNSRKETTARVKVPKTAVACKEKYKPTPSSKDGKRFIQKVKETDSKKSDGTIDVTKGRKVSTTSAKSEKTKKLIPGLGKVENKVAVKPRQTLTSTLKSPRTESSKRGAPSSASSTSNLSTHSSGKATTSTEVSSNTTTNHQSNVSDISCSSSTEENNKNTMNILRRSGRKSGKILPAPNLTQKPKGSPTATTRPYETSARATVKAKSGANNKPSSAVVVPHGRSGRVSSAGTRPAVGEKRGRASVAGGAKPRPLTIAAASKEITRLEALCEERTKDVGYAKLRLKEMMRAFDGMSVFGEYLTSQLEAFETPRLKRQMERSEQLLVTTQQQLDNVIVEKNDREVEIEQLNGNLRRTICHYEQQVADVEFRMKEELKIVEEKYKVERMRLMEEHEVEKEVWMKHRRDLENRRIEEIKNMEEKLQDTKTRHEGDIYTIKECHSKEIEKWKQETTELEIQHSKKLDDEKKRHEDKCEVLEIEIDQYKEELGRADEKAKEWQAVLLKDSDKKIQMALAEFKDMPNEISSLRAVLDLRSQETSELRLKNLTLQTQVEEVASLRSHVLKLEQRNEELQAVIDGKNKQERRLTLTNQSLVARAEHNDKEKSLLQMEKEELQYKLQQKMVPSSPDVSRKRHGSSSSTTSAGSSGEAFYIYNPSLSSTRRSFMSELDEGMDSNNVILDDEGMQTT